MNKRNKTIMLNSLVFLFCVIIIILYCLTPPKKPEIAKLQTYEVTFDTDGGSFIPSMSIEEGHAIEAPDTPTKEGYIFDGWELDGDLYNFSDLVSGNIILRAKWREITPDTVVYIVTFDTDGGSSIPEQNVIENELTSRPGDPTRDGYEFIEWQLNGLPYDFSLPVTGNITLYAIWNEVSEPEPDPEDDTTYTVRFDLNGGNGSAPPNQEVRKGRRATVPSNPSRTDYVFVGWNTNKNATTGNIRNYTINSDTTFYAIWAKDVKTYTVTINLAGGTKPSNCDLTQTVAEGGSPSGCISVSRQNYNFNGWTDGSKTEDYLSSFTITKNTTITAKWTPKTQYTYRVNVELNNGSGCNAISQTSYETSLRINLTCRPTAPHFYQSFSSWKLNGNNVTSVTLTSANPTATVSASYNTERYTVVCTHPIDPLSHEADPDKCLVTSSPAPNGTAVYYRGGNKAVGTSPILKTRFDANEFDVCKDGDCVNASK